MCKEEVVSRIMAQDDAIGCRATIHEEQLQQEVAELHKLCNQGEAEKELLRRRSSILFDQVAALEAQNTEQLKILIKKLHDQEHG
jgi:hypothetical protein